MKILVIHNRYSVAGGEDMVFDAETRMLRDHQHTVVTFDEKAEAIRNTLHAGEMAANAAWSRKWHSLVRQAVREQEIDLVHVHNWLPVFSPSIFSAAIESGAATVHSIHNYRLFCLNGTLLRDGRVCQICSRVPMLIPGVAHGCYRQSRSQSAALAGVLWLHRRARSWRQIDAFIAPSKFARQKVVEFGLDPDSVMIKPHFVNSRAKAEPRGRNVLFIGRLSHEKGLSTLIGAWEAIRCNATLEIIGDGPLRGLVEDVASRVPAVKWFGALSEDEVHKHLWRAQVVVCPSECYETFGRVVIEAFSAGTPVIASDIGALPELVTEGLTGLLFRPGDLADLAKKIKWVLSSESEMSEMGRNARREYEEKYTAERNYEMLMDIYQQAIENAQRRYADKKTSRRIPLFPR